MAPLNLAHRRTHNLLLISKLLSLRDTASPLTLLVDSLEQPAIPLTKEYIRRAKVGNCDKGTECLAELIASAALQGPCYAYRLRNPKTARGGRCIHLRPS